MPFLYTARFGVSVLLWLLTVTTTTTTTTTNSLNINGITVKRCDSVKYLGV